MRRILASTALAIMIAAAPASASAFTRAELGVAGPLEMWKRPACLYPPSQPGADEPSCVAAEPKGGDPVLAQIEARLNRAAAYWMHQMHDRALAEIGKAKALAPESVEVWHFSARYALTLDKLAEARGDLERAMAMSADNSLLLSTWAYFESVDRRYLAAVDAYEKAIRLDPKNTFALYQLLQIYKGTRNETAQDRVFNQLAEADPKHPSVRGERLGKAIASGDHTTAISMLDEQIAEARRPDFGALLTRAGLYQGIGNHEKAIGDYTAILGEGNEMPRFAIGGAHAGKIYFARALSFVALNRGAEARADVTKALAQADGPLVLRLQVYLRQMKIDVELTGQNSRELLDAAVACVSSPACGRSLATAI